MPVRLILIVLLACLAAVATPARAADGQTVPPIKLSTLVKLSALGEDSSLIGRAEFLMEPAHRMSLDAALRSDGWAPATEAVRKRGLTDARVWMRFSVENDTAAPQDIIVTHDIIRLTEFAAVALSSDGQRVRATYDPMQAYQARPLAYAGPAAVLTVPAGERRDVVVRFGNDHPIPIHLNLRLWSEHGFERYSVAKMAFFVFWIGCLATAASFWLLYGVFMRQVRMVVYAVYMAAVASTYVIFSGAGLQLLLPSSTWFQHLGFNWSVFLMACSAFEFARRHLDIERLHPIHNKVLRVAVLVFAAATVLAFPSRFPAIETPLTYAAVIVMPLYITWLSWVAWRRDRLSYAVWMVFGWGSVSVTGLMIICFSVVFIPLQSTSHIAMVRLTFASIVVESLLLSASLAQWLRGQEVRRIAAERDAGRDALTGLLNRRGFDAYVAAVKSRGAWPGALWLVLADFDQFKRINDTHSHVAGDAVLTHFANILRHEFRAETATARFGGEEFIVMFQASSQAAAVDVVERVCGRFADTPTRFDGTLIEHTLSAGLVRVADGPVDDEATLIAMADKALYAAKRAGRNCVRVYDPAGGESREAVTELGPIGEPVTVRS